MIGKAVRSNSYNISPFALEVDPVRFNSRAGNDAYTEAKLKEKALSLRDEGQLQPIKVVQRRGQQPLVVYGIGRTLGARYGIDNGILPQDWMIRYEVMPGDDSDEKRLFLANLMENHARENLTPVDYAAIVSKMKRDFNMSHSEIAAKLQRTKAWVSGMLRLPGLPPEWMQQIAAGEMHVECGISLARLPLDQAQRIHAYITGRGWAFTMANFKRALRETEEKTERAPNTASGSKAGRSIKEIREFADELGDAGAPLRQFLDGGDPMPLRALLAGSPDVTVEALTLPVAAPAEIDMEAFLRP